MNLVQDTNRARRGASPRRLLRRAAGLTLALLVALSLSACGGSKKVVSEEEIRQDLQSWGRFARGDLTITDLQIEERETSPEDFEDTIWVSVQVENDDLKGTMYYVAKYRLYDDGWEIDSAVPYQDAEFVPLKPPSDELIRSWLNTEATFSYAIACNLDERTADFSVILTEEHVYCTVKTRRFLYCRFDSHTGEWKADIQDPGLRFEEWDVDGVYKCEFYDRYSNQERCIEFEIRNFDPNAYKIDGWIKGLEKYDYDYDNTKPTDVIEGPFWLSNDGYHYTVKNYFGLFDRRPIMRITYDEVQFDRSDLGTQYGYTAERISQ